MKNPLHRLADFLRAHPARLFFGVLVTLTASSFLLSVLTASPAAPVAPPAETTYRESWTLLELTRHIEAGDVVAITAATGVVIDPDATSAPAQDQGPAGRGYVGGPANLAPLAVLRSGQRVPIALSVGYADAIDSLRSAGYDRLLSAEAVSAAATRYPAGTASSPFGSIGTLLFIFLVMSGALYLISRATSGSAGSSSPATRAPNIRGGFRVVRRTGDTRNMGTARPTRLADVAGIEEAKEEVLETIDFLRAPERFTALGAKVPRGVLFYGPPGTGKTMLARAVASEANVDFFSASGSEFVELYVGVGAARVRELFREAQSSVESGGGAVVFIDELDALARKRGGPNSNDERESTLNELLVAMDGFASSDRVVIIGATNRIDTLDAAVLRPGRFTRKIPIPLPDRVGREEILRVHATGKPLDESIDLALLARSTAGYSGADLADLLNEAAILAARRNEKRVVRDDIRAAMLKLALGVGRRRSMPPRERSIIAAHEAGHAIVGRVFGDSSRVDHISLYQHGDALGVTVTQPTDDNSLPSESTLHAMLAKLMGGRAAEEICFHEVTGGAADDFAKATDVARRMVEVWGLPHGRRGELGFLVGETASAETTAARERAIREILDDAYDTARRTLLDERARLDRVAAYLFENERIDGDEFAAVFEGRLHPTSSSLGAWRDAASRPRDWSEIDELAAAMGELPIPVASPAPSPAPPEPLAAIRRVRRRPLSLLGRLIAAVRIILDRDRDGGTPAASA